MAAEHFLTLDGNEIVNSARAYAAAAAHSLPVRCDPCPTLPAGIQDAAYTGNPITDEAPWWDPSNPASARFLGVMGMGVTGLSSDPVERATTALIGDGSALGTLRRTQREIEYTVLLLALDEFGLAYGYHWLASALRGGVCANTCGTGSEMCFIPGCPPDDVTGGEELRHLYRVGLLDGLEEQERNYLTQGGACDSAASADSCCDGSTFAPVAAEATFTIVAGNPYIYREPIAYNDAGSSFRLATGQLLTGYDPDALYDDCPTAVDCLEDPTCLPPDLPPQVPVPVNPCYTSGPMTARRLWIPISDDLMPLWGQLVPYVEIFSGTSALRRLLIRFYPNPGDFDCATTVGADLCGSCTSLGVNYLPPRSTLTLDGRVQNATVDCSTTTARGTTSPQLYGPQGTVFSWPVFECPSGLCVEVIALNSSVTASTTIDFSLIPRGDAA